MSRDCFCSAFAPWSSWEPKRHNTTSSAAQPGQQESTPTQRMLHSPSEFSGHNLILHNCNISCVNSHDKTCYRRKSHISCLWKVHSLESKTSTLLHHLPNKYASKNVKRSFSRPFTWTIGTELLNQKVQNCWIKSKRTSEYQAGQMRRNFPRKHAH
jgi:hypothetical protein